MKKNAQEQAQAQAQAQAMGQPTEGFGLSVQSRLTEVDGHKAFTYIEKTKDGELVSKTVYEPSVVAVYEKVDYLTQVARISVKALCIELGHLDIEGVKKAGIKGGFNGFISKCFGRDLDTNTAQRYRRIGKVFGRSYVDETGKTQYMWHEPISQDVSVTNLGQVLSLVDLPKEWEDMEDAEIFKLYKRFIDNYVLTGKISLDSTLKDLRQAMKDLKTEVATVNATEVSSEPVQAQEKEVTPEMVQAEKTEEATMAVQTLYTYFEGNTTVLAMLAQIAEAIGNDAE